MSKQTKEVLRIQSDFVDALDVITEQRFMVAVFLNPASSAWPTKSANSEF